MSTLTRRQRQVLQHRIERAICWHMTTTSNRDASRSMAIHVLDEIDQLGMDGKTAERAVTNIAERLERPA